MVKTLSSFAPFPVDRYGQRINFAIGIKIDTLVLIQRCNREKFVLFSGGCAEIVLGFQRGITSG